MGTPLRRPEWEEGYYKVKKIAGHRVKYDGSKEYLVQWKGLNLRPQQLWEDSWMVVLDDVF